MFDVPSARTWEWALPSDTVDQFVRQLPEAGSPPGHIYTALPDRFNQPNCVGANCVTWVDDVLRSLTGADGEPFRIGEVGQSPIVDLSSSGEARPGAGRQQVFIDLIDRATPDTMEAPSGTQNVVGGRMPTGMRVLRVGGQLFGVAGFTYSAYRISNAPRAEQPRVIMEEAGSQVGGLVGFELGMAGCILAGVATGGLFLIVCGVGGGLLGGAAGHYGGGLASQIPDYMVQEAVNQGLESDDPQTRTDAVAVRNWWFGGDWQSQLYLISRFLSMR